MTVTDKPSAHDTNADASSAIRDAAADIGVYLALWAMRDDARPCPDERRAANSAMDAIDRALAELYQLRGRLVTEIRVSDDVSAARAEAMDAAAKRPDQRAAVLAQRMTHQNGRRTVGATVYDRHQADETGPGEGDR